MEIVRNYNIKFCSLYYYNYYNVNRTYPSKIPYKHLLFVY